MKWEAGRKGESCTPETEKLSYTKFPSLYPKVPYFTTFSLEVRLLRKFWFPVVGGVSGKGRTPMIALSEVQHVFICTSPFLYPSHTDSERAFCLALYPLVIQVGLLSPCPGEAR